MQLKDEVYYLAQKIKANIHAYKAFEQEAVKQCWTNDYVSAYNIFQKIRHDRGNFFKRRNRFKIDNSLTPAFVNLFVLRNPEFKTLFVIKKQINFSCYLQEINDLCKN